MDSAGADLKTQYYVSCEIIGKMMSGAFPIGDQQGRARFPIIILLPITLVTLLTLIFQMLLKPIGDATFVSQMLAGLLLGPTFLEQNIGLSEKIFPPMTTMFLKSIEVFGFIFMFFSQTARVDKGIFKKCGRLAIIVGIGSFLLPIVVTTFVTFIVEDAFPFNPRVKDSLLIVAVLQSTTSFHGTCSLLTDLKLLNSEIGRIALSSSFISGLLSWLFAELLSIASKEKYKRGNYKQTAMFKHVSFVFMVLVIVFAVRPTIVWMMRQTPEGKSLKRSHVLTIILLVLGFAFFGEVTGQHAVIGPIILGLSIPVKPPMGALLVDKIQYFVWAVFMPCFLINTGRRINLVYTELDSFLVVELLILVATSAKLFAIIIPSLYYKIPFKDAVSLGLLLNCRGIYDIQTFSRVKQRLLFSADCYGVMVVTAVLQSIVIMQLLRAIYDSSKRYVAYGDVTIQKCSRHAELRILACILELDDVPAIINILEASNPPQSSVAVYAMNLEEYVGRSIPLVIQHKLDGSSTPSHDLKRSTKMLPFLNAFRLYEQQKIGYMSVQCYTAIAPYVSIHDDICSMAFKKSTSLIILPFNKTKSPIIKRVLKNTLKMAPCSVGILHDYEMFSNSKPIFTRRVEINVCMVFFGGPDDREALAYGARMADPQQTNIKLTVIRIIAKNKCDSTVIPIEGNGDVDTINHFKISYNDNKNVEYVERGVTEGCDTARLLQSITYNFDLILVGRRQDTESQELKGLAEWRETEELGVVGDFLTCSDFKSKASVMVIQQQVIN